MKRRNKATCWFLCIVMAFAAGCSKQETSSQAPQQKSEPQAKKPLQKQMSSAAKEGATPRQFDFTAKRDPFKTFVAPVQKAEKPAVSSSIRWSGGIPLQSYDVQQFKVIGLIAGLKENRGMVVDPSGKGYVVKEGMEIGRNNGRIVKITAAYIEVLEQYRTDSGKIKKRIVRLTLPRKE